MNDVELRDEKLVERIAEGDTFSFQVIIERYKKRVFSIAYRFLTNTYDAEDLAQDAFLKLFYSAKKYKPTASFKTWFFRIVSNMCIDFLRKKKIRKAEAFTDIPSDRIGPDKELELSERQKIVGDAVQDLPERQRIALILSHYEGLRYREIAMVMNCSVKSVEALLARAKNTLRERLSREL